MEMKYFGVDLHKDQATWHCITRIPGGELERTAGKILTCRLEDDFLPLLSEDGCYVIVEASGSTFFFASLIAAHCTRVIVVNPVAFREMYMSGKKTDRIDAKRLADRLMYHIEMHDTEDGFPEVFSPDTETLKVRKLITSYELLVKQMTQLKNQFKAIPRAKMIADHDDGMDDGFEMLCKNQRLDNADLIIMKALKDARDALGKEKENIRNAIIEIGVFRFRSEIDLLTSISGVSVMGAIVFMSDIVTVDRFASAKEMTSYLASVGKVDSSGTTTRNGGLNRRGRRTSYRFILQGLEHIVRGNKSFASFKERHVAKKANKVRAAIVRKTFVAMYYMLKNNEQYRYLDVAVYRRKQREIVKVLKNVA
jgi:transposase